MAKVVTQSIPSEERIRYKRALQISTNIFGNIFVRTRYPWRIPHMQAGGAGETKSQRIQRDRFRYAKNKYALLSAYDKARWVAANPEYHSYLFGYNFFMLEGLMGGGTVEYPQMIKSIQVQKAEIPTSGGYTFALSPTIDGDKGVVMIQGSARKVPRVIRGVGAIAAGGATLNLGVTIDPGKCSVRLNGPSYKEQAEGAFVNVNPILANLSVTQIMIDWPYTPDAGVDVGYEVIEHLEGAVYPVLVSITDAQVVLDWAEVPDAPADASISVIEYL